MQSINRTVLNPLFGTVFFGTALLCVVLARLHCSGGMEPGRWNCWSAASSMWLAPLQ
jgi:uncharacterized membrane protein